ncbi:histidine kinase [Terrimonas sp.]|uniref:sensor histidine kinase n=1 Tax=Terrimonas sp. TaxID=1914338 RepID=UPI000D50967D|nr:ATP-binding protein [Terrimonas sp.]PVD52063.1 histidine kinase [Terrimonas sp.]
MKARTKYILFVVILHLIAITLTWFIFDNKVFFIVAEVFIIISIILSWQLYRQLIQPLKLLMEGTQAIKDRDFNVKFLPTGKHEIDELIVVYNQMMDELRRERTRQEQQHFFLEKLIHTSPTGIVILDFDQRIHDINPRALQLLQAERTQLLSSSVYEISHPVIVQLRDLQVGGSKTFTYNNTATYKIQKSSFVDRGFPRHFIMIEELTAEILAAEKKAYGKVIRMMAHEVNNSIGSVNSIIQSTVISDTLWENGEHTSLKDALQVAINRNYNLNVFMRNFADLVRLPDPQKKNINLPEMIRSVIKLMEMKAGEKNIQFIYDMPGDAFYITADPQQMEQVLINIVKNAIEAIASEGYIVFNINRYKRELTVANNGKEITREEAAQLFSPFFSTKKDGQGIGLMLVKEILTNHGFAFSLKTVEPDITEFVIRF